MDSLFVYRKVQSDGTDTEMSFKTDFLKECPDPYAVELCDLFQKHNVQKFLHNPVGSACINHTHGYKAYWLNGNLLDPNSEEVKKIEHLGQFNKGFTTMLESPVEESEKTG